MKSPLQSYLYSEVKIARAQNKAIDFTSSPTEGLVARQGQYMRWKEEVVDSKDTEQGKLC